MKKDRPSGPVYSGPSQEEIAARQTAQQERIDTTQDFLGRETDRLFRLYGARRSFGGA